MAIRAVLFDVGGPLNTEVEHERRTDAEIHAALAAESVTVGDDAYAEAERWAVNSFASDAYQAIVWRLCGGDAAKAARVYDRFHASRAPMPFELREGMAGLLAELHARGLRLGLAANQPLSTIAVLDRHGIGRYFDHREVSETHGYRKPDPRLFLRACADLAVEPAECIMVGDRIDNDIVPARLLRMTTVLLRTGRHIAQEPRSWLEVPDAEVRDVEELRRVLLRLT